MPFLGEAMRAFEEGLGTAEDIDTGAKVGLNHPMGPLELADFIGLDVCLHIMEVLHDGFGAPHMAPPPGPAPDGRRGPPGPEDRPRLLHLPAQLDGSDAPAPMTGGLTDEERLLQQTVRDFAPARSRAGRRAARRGGALRPLALHADGRAGPDGRAVPERRSVAPASATAPGRWSWRRSRTPTWRWRCRCSVHILSQYPVITWGTDEQKARWLPDMLAGREAGRLRPDRAAGGLRRVGALKLRAERIGTADAPDVRTD